MLKKKNFLIFLASSLLILIIFVQSTKKPSSGGEVYAEGYNSDLSGLVDLAETVGYFAGQNIEIPKEAFAKDVAQPVLGAVADNKWIEVDLSDQKLYAWEGGNLFLETPISSGLPQTPTPKGEFNIWIKLRASKMEGGRGSGYYYLPNVPYVMFFEGSGIPGWKGYGLHGTYWHSDFGRPRSHGCVNLPTEIAKRLYEWTSPVLSGKNVVKAQSDNLGTKIVIHD